MWRKNLEKTLLVELDQKIETSESKTVTAKLSSQTVTQTKPKIESNVIKIIQREWDKEVERLDAKKSGFKPKQQIGDSKLLL